MRRLFSYAHALTIAFRCPPGKPVDVEVEFKVVSLGEINEAKMVGTNVHSDQIIQSFLISGKPSYGTMTLKWIPF